MGLASGTKLGPYEIVSAIGAGGMGEVYRARDARLGRDVAIKVLPQSVASDRDRLLRFEQEARSVAALNHANVLAIFDVGEADQTAYLVSELLEGEPLRNKLQAGPLSQRRTVEYAVQIAEGLAAAHDKGIVHRDLKPENIFISKDGRVKILDFGLAKLTRAESKTAAAPDGLTVAQTQTTPGMIVGTAGYMSPEQVRGQDVDARTDIFSFGAILYEMLSGERAFKGETSVETMNAILKEDPPELDTDKLQVAPGLERIVRRCLEKEPEQRFHSARDVKFAIEALSTSSSATQVRIAQRRGTWQWAGIAVVALMVVAALAGIALRLGARKEAVARPMHFAIPMRGDVNSLAISKDGTMMAFVSPDESSGKNVLNVQTIGSDKATALSGTEGAQYPFWSPDGEYVGYFANGKLLKIRARGGDPQPLAAVSPSPRGGAWSSKGVIIYAPAAEGPLWRVNADGTGAASLTERMLLPREVSHRWPIFLPDGEHFLFFGGDFVKQGEMDGIYASSLHGGGRKLLMKAESNLEFAEPGYLFFMDDAGRLMMRNFDANKLEVTGEGSPVIAHVGYHPSTLWGAFTVSENGTVVASATEGTSRSVLTWYDRSGKELGTVSEAGVFYNPALSPDGRRVAHDVADLLAETVHIWLQDLGGKSGTRFTFGRDDGVAVWSPDGSQIAYRAVEGDLHLKPANGLGTDRVMVHSTDGDDVLPNSWSPDGRSLVCTYHRGRGGSRLMLVSLSDGKRTPLLNSDVDAMDGQISPDGKWLAYASNESGTWQIYVTTLLGAQGKWQVSQGGGTEPRWRRDGKEMFYINSKGMMTAVAITANGTFSSGAPRELFAVRSRPPIASTDLYSYDVTKDGQRFLINKYHKPSDVAPLEIVLNATK